MDAETRLTSISEARKEASRLRAEADAYLRWAAEETGKLLRDKAPAELRHYLDPHIPWQLCTHGLTVRKYWARAEGEDVRDLRECEKDLQALALAWDGVVTIEIDTDDSRVEACFIAA